MSRALPGRRLPCGRLLRWGLLLRGGGLLLALDRRAERRHQVDDVRSGADVGGFLDILQHALALGLRLLGDHALQRVAIMIVIVRGVERAGRSAEPPSELQSLMRISYA